MNRSIRPLVLLTVVSLSSVAVAVVPGSRAVIRRFAERQALDRVTASPLYARITMPNKPTPGSGRVDLTLPASCKAQVELPDGKGTLSYANGKVTNQGTSATALEAFMAFGCPLMAMKNVPAGDAEGSFEKLATAWGVDLGVTSLGLLDGHAAYVIGAKPRELTKPQVWVDKSTDRVIRVIGNYGGSLWDLRFDDPGSVATNRLAPRVTQVWQDKKQVLTVHLMAAEPKVTGPAAASDPVAEED